ncbi:MAG: HDIG domain-containing protein [Tissierellia bacterium]|nr:HDIG domain-containing protein [Tissierellia bacterium]
MSVTKRKRIKDMKTSLRKKLNFIIIIIFIAALILFDYNIKDSRHKSIIIGEAAPTDVFSHNTFEDELATKNNRELARENTANIYKYLPNVAIESRDKLSFLFDELKAVRYHALLSEEDKLKQLKSHIDLNLSDEDLNLLMNLDYKQLNNLQDTLNDLMVAAYNRGIKIEELEYVQNNLLDSIDTIVVNEKLRQPSKDIIAEILTYNEIVDEAATEIAKNEAEAAVKPVIVAAGDRIFEKGEMVTPNSAAMLEKAGIQVGSVKRGPIDIAKSIIKILLPTILWTYYMYNYQTKVYLSSMLYLLLFVDFVVILLSIIAAQFTIYAMPILISTLISAMFYEKEINFINSAVLGVLICAMGNWSYEALIYLIAISFLTAMFVKDFDKKSSVFLKAIAAAIFATLLSLASLNYTIAFKNAIISLAYSVGTAIISVIIVLGSAPVWEGLFGIVTHQKLYELTNTKAPILKRLAEEAPGTYQHSMMVANLSENAAKRIGADHILARVGAYYHDIGKLSNPKYFSENQFGIENPHNDLSPYDSAAIILRHVDYGVELALKEELPDSIINFIKEHHGTTKVAYFLHTAKEKNENVNEELFRYSGRKPQSKETAILMLADSCEAAVRSIKNPTDVSIKNMIDNIFRQKVDDQFGECNLTFKELEEIKDEMKRNLTAIHHDRIEYPKGEADD